MPAIANENSRLAWLMGRLANRRNRVTELLRRLTGFGPPSAIKPSLFAKFLHMMDDVAAATKEETSLIGRIEDIEQQHRHMRTGKRLKQAMPGAKNTALVITDDSDLEAPQPQHKLLKWLVLWYMFMRQGNKP